MQHEILSQLIICFTLGITLVNINGLCQICAYRMPERENLKCLIWIKKSLIDWLIKTNQFVQLTFSCLYTRLGRQAKQARSDANVNKKAQTLIQGLPQLYNELSSFASDFFESIDLLDMFWSFGTIFVENRQFFEDLTKNVSKSGLLVKLKKSKHSVHYKGATAPGYFLNKVSKISSLI